MRLGKVLTTTPRSQEERGTAVLARLYRDHRSAARHEVALEATLRGNDRRPYDVVVEGLSTTGLLIPAVTSSSPGEQVAMGLPGIGLRHVRVVREAAGDFVCKFLRPLHSGELAEVMVTEPAKPIALPLSPPRPTQKVRMPQ